MNVLGDMAHSTRILSATQVADYFLFKASSEHKVVTNKKLQKLLYYAQAWSLAARDQKLFNEKIEAWVHGPAVRKVYLEYKKFGAEPIQKEIPREAVADIPTEVTGFLDEVWQVYGKFDAAYLERLSHSENPWREARAGIEAHVGSKNEITLNSMRDFYRTKLETRG